MKKKYNRIYLDGAANTPLDKKVFRAMKPYFKDNFVGNSHAIHEQGIKVMTAIEDSRAECEKALGCGDHHQVFFTSGATEGNNWVIKSLAYHARSDSGSKRNTIVCSAVEHSSVLNTCKQLETEGFNVIYVNPRPSGRIFIKDIEKVINNDTILVCLMAVNNETGVTNHINQVAKYAHLYRAYLLTDCTQALTYGGAYTKIASIYSSADYLTFSGHKIYGPTGTGILVKRNAAPLYPLITGGSQELGLRGGTHNTAGIVGIAAALKLMAQNSYSDHFNQLYEYFTEQIDAFNKEYKTKIHINGTLGHKNIINLNCSSIYRFSSLASLLDGFGLSVSAGSACDANAVSIPSHVLLAMGIPLDDIGSCIRISFTKDTTKKDIQQFFTILKKLFALWGK